MLRDIVIVAILAGCVALGSNLEAKDKNAANSNSAQQVPTKTSTAKKPATDTHHVTETPVQEAIRRGYKEFERINAVMDPLIHVAYPQKDYRAMIAAGPEVDSATAALSDLKYKTHNNFKLIAYKDRVSDLKRTVIDYVTAVEKKDSEAVYGLFPQLRQGIDNVALALRPLPWKEFEDFYSLARDMDNSKINPEVNPTLVTGKLEKLETALTKFTASPIPAEITERSKLIADEQTYFVTLLSTIKDLQNHDTNKFRTKTTELSVRLGTFEYMYLQ